MTGESAETFYRALFTPDHYDRWARRDFTSSHHDSPPEWGLRFRETGGSLSESDYDRKSAVYGEMTERSLRTWLQLKREGRDAQTDEERFALGEVPGVCAFRTAQQALDRYQGEADDPILRFVAFRGRYIGLCMAGGSNWRRGCHCRGDPMPTAASTRICEQIRVRRPGRTGDLHVRR
jgi:hypothetical protein